ncbi:MAG: arginase family protein [Candidatus Margulisbacteria bacterium]|nr:arginase family protein [Candidatus Margulisiibacteriota bacterium]
MLPCSKDILDKNIILRPIAKKIIQAYEHGDNIDLNKNLAEQAIQVNKGCHWLNQQVHLQTKSLLDAQKLVGVVGGSHGVSLGFIKALSNHYESFGILQLDAHMDLRSSYLGMTYSHACVMHHALEVPSVSKLVQVGVRDYEEDGLATVNQSKGKIVTYFDKNMKDQRFEGTSWKKICSEIIHQLPENVYISLDIDGLQSWLCPNTGTPVPGGLSFDEAMFLVSELVKSKRKIIGFDLVEVSPGPQEWGGVVGARLLYYLCGFMHVSLREIL